MKHPARAVQLPVAALFAVAVLFATSSYAQFAPAANPLKLSAKSDQVIAALASLDQLPVSGWRTHSGDIAHGESPTLDDASWTATPNNTNFGSDAVWFRKTVEVPRDLHGYDLTGTSINFSFDIRANGPVPLIVYFDGRRVAMGENLEPIQLFVHAKPGDKVVIAVKALHTVDIKEFKHSTLKISYAGDRPNSSDIRLQAISAQYLLPALLPNPAQQLGVLDAAISTVDLNALQAGDQKAFDASLQSAQQQMEALRPTLSQASFHLTGNAHIDAAWLWPWTETVDVAKRTFSTALQLMDEYPKYTFSQSAAAYNEWIADKYPDINQGIQSRVKEGRWEIVGGMWVEPDLNMPDGESLVRQLLIGKRFFKQQYGVDVRIGWNPDSFGYNWQLPQIYKKSGVDYFVTQKMAWNDTNQLPLKLFYWQSPDGSRVLTYFPHDYVNETEPDRLAKDFNIARQENPGLPEMMHLYGIGDHGGGPTRAMLDVADRWTVDGIGDKVFPPTQYGIAQTFFTPIEKTLDTAHAPVWNYATLAAGKAVLPQPPAGKTAIPVWNDELYLEVHRGAFTTQAAHKRNMRDSEEWMLNAEKWSSLAWLAGKDYPAAKLNEAWKKVLFNQFHDLAAGSGIAVIYRDAQKDYDMVHFTADQARSSAMATLDSAADTAVPAGTVPVMVWNPLAWTRTDVVEATVQLPRPAEAISIEDSKGAAVPFRVLKSEPATGVFHINLLARDVPAMGYAVYRAKAAGGSAKPAGGSAKAESGSAKATSGVKQASDASSTTIENSMLRVTVDNKTGCITSMYDKQAKFESLAAGACGNQIQAFKDLPKQYDAWNIDMGTYDHFTPVDEVDSVKLLESSPLRATIRVTRSWQSSKFMEEISLVEGIDRVVITDHIDWHEKHVLLKAAFPLAASGPMATYEIPYGTIQRPTTRNNSWEKARFEVPALRWADLGDGKHGVSLLNNSKYGYDAQDNVLRLTLLRSPTWPDANADQGPQQFSFALYPHSGDWKQALTERRGYEFNYKLRAIQVAPHAGTLPASYSFAKVEPENLVLTAIKKTEDGDGLLLRFYEWAGKAGNATITLPHGVTGATLTNLMEIPEGAALATTATSVTVPYTAYGITTVRVSFGDRGPGFLAAK